MAQHSCLVLPNHFRFVCLNIRDGRQASGERALLLYWVLTVITAVFRTSVHISEPGPRTIEWKEPNDF